MKKLLLGAVIVSSLLLVVVVPRVGAESLRVTPLQYTTELKKGEKKKGHVDIANASNETVTVKLYVNGFKQVDNKGNLTFFDDEQLQKGILLDYETAVIGAQQTLRLYFIADGAKLPTGDVFGVIFAETQPVTSRPGTVTTVRVGSLIMLTNGTPGPRSAEITDLSVPFFQVGDTLDGSMTIKNSAPKGSATGFFPQITVEAQPWGGAVRSRGPLIFAGNQRTADFRLSSSQFGFYVVKVKANNAEVSKLVFLMTGWWRVIAPLLAVVLIGGGIAAWKYWLRGKFFKKTRRKA